MKICREFVFVATIVVLFSISILETRANSECSSNRDCSLDNKCRQSQCVNACARFRDSNSEPENCGMNSYCAVRGKAHDGICKCEYGYEGDPYVGCTEKSG